MREDERWEKNILQIIIRYIKFEQTMPDFVFSNMPVNGLAPPVIRISAATMMTVFWYPVISCMYRTGTESINPLVLSWFDKNHMYYSAIFHSSTMMIKQPTVKVNYNQLVLSIIITCNDICAAYSEHHDDVIKWKHFPRYWPFVWGIHRPRVNSPHKGQWCRALMFSLICTWINGWVNNREAGDLRCNRAHYDATQLSSLAPQNWLAYPLGPHPTVTWLAVGRLFMF